MSKKVSLLTKRMYLENQGIIVGPRLQCVNTDHEGSYMVIENDITVPCRNADEAGGFAIVGNDISDLIGQAFDHFSI